MKVKINTFGGPLPEVHGDWIDLFTAEEVVMKAGDYKEISLGVAMELPKDCYAMMLPRSSTFKRYGIQMANSMAIIDNDYCGNDDIWHFLAYATRDVVIPARTRICQFSIAKKAEAVEFDPVNELTNSNRGGIGSTGSK